MKKTIGYYIFFTLLLHFSLRAQQKVTETEKREMFFRIAAAKRINNDSVIALLSGGKKLGIEMGTTGVVKGVYKTNDDRSNLELGFANVFKVTDTSAFISIKPTDKTGTKKAYEIRQGDYVVLKIKVPKLPYRSIFFELALQDIQFNNLYADKLYEVEDLFYRDGKKLEDSLLQASAKDVFATYDALKDDTTFNSLKQPLQQGRYTGRSVFDVMKNCLPADIKGFLNYVSNYPNKYIGNTWKMNETFATWVFNNAPYSQREILDSILAYKNNPAKLKAFINKTIALIKEKDFVNDWISDAATALEEDNTTKAKQLFEVAKLIIPFLENDCTTGYYYYSYTPIFKNDEQKIIKYLDSAYHFFNKCGNDYFKVQTLLKKGLTYNDKNKDELALQEYQKALAEINKADSKLKPEQKKSFLAKYYYFSGVSLFALSDYIKAAEHYTLAIKAYKEINTFSALQTATTLQGRLARLYKKQGELVKAIDIYTEQLKTYTQLNDKKNMADVYYNIGDIAFDRADYKLAVQYFVNARNIYNDFLDYDNVGYTEASIAQAYYSLGNYDSAIAIHQSGIQYRKKANSNNGLGFSFKKLASLYSKTGDKNKSLQCYDSAAYYYGITKDSARLRELLSDIGDVYTNDKQYQKAFGYYFKWHQLNMAAKNKSDITNSSYQLAWAAYNFNLDTAEYYFKICLQSAKDIGDKNNEFYAKLGLGSVMYKRYNYPEGEKYFKEGLEIAQKEKNKKQEALGYRIVGSAYHGKLDFDNAINYFNKSIHLYDSLGDKSSLPFVYRCLGGAIQGKGDFYEARKYYQKAIDLAYQINNRAEVAYGYNDVTFLYIIQGELKKAEQAVDSSYAIFKELDNSWQIAASYFNLGLVYEAKSDGVNAVKYYKMADSIYTKENDILSSAGCYNNIGAVFYYQADYKNALYYFYETDKILSKVKTITEAHILAQINIGETYFYLKEYPKAEKYLTDGYKLAIEKKTGRMHTISSSFLGTLYYEMNKLPLSEKYLLEAFALAQKSNESDLFINTGMYLGKLYTATNQPAKAEEYYRKTLQFISTIDNSKYTWMAYYEYGLNQYNQNKMDTAVVYFKKAVEIVENSSKNLFGGAEAKKIYSADERKVDLYNKLVAALAKLNKTDEALYYANQGNVQAVKEKTESAGFTTTDKEKADAIKKGSELLQKKNAVTEAIAKEKAKPEKEQNKKLIASLESVQHIAENEYANFIDGMIKQYPDLQSYFSNTNPNDFRNYIEYIPDSTLVALYIVNDNQLFIFTVTNKETSIKTIALKQDINKQAARLLSILRNPNNATGTGAVTLRSTLKPVDDVRGDFKTEATELYNLLITPIADDLKGKKNLCVITNGKLGSIPFQSLGIKDDKGGFKFLMEDYAVFYTSKIDIFAKAYKSRKMESSLAVFGNPDKTLPGATLEAKEIAKIVPSATVFIENTATEGKAKESLQKFNYIHFATHGVLDYNNFNDSYLVFTADEGSDNDGKLTIKEINGLTKQTNSMVVLSACETAVAKEEVKGWYISPANAFLTNRVEAVLGSLWKVPDETTNLLLQEFYKNLEIKKMTKVEALRHAQAAVSSNPKFAHPFYWSAFVLYGEWR